ncbi:MAG: hypothetical protein OEN50_08585, partial [Deltaproteobacteria bacterium]|nr:hypothetical protein [Deltaproteobacteria bacterium]
LNGKTLLSVELSPEELACQDCLVILTDHSSYDLKEIIASVKLVIDTRNATKGCEEFKDRIIKLGAGNKTPLSGPHELAQDTGDTAHLGH